LNTLEQDFLEHLLVAIGHRNDIRIHRQNCGQVVTRTRAGQPTGVFKAGPPPGACDLSGIVSPEGWRLEIELKGAKTVVRPGQENWAKMIKFFGGVWTMIRFNECMTMDENVKTAVDTIYEAVAERRSRLSHEPHDPFYDQRTELIESLRSDLVNERALSDALLAYVPRCDNEHNNKRCTRPATKRSQNGIYNIEGIYAWCDECAKDHYVVYPGTPHENLYPSPRATVDDMPIAEPIRAIQRAREAK
jgi:hypothetical protein